MIFDLPVFFSNILVYTSQLARVGEGRSPFSLRTLLRSHTALPLTSHWLEHSHMVVNFKGNSFFGWEIMDSAKNNNSGVLVTSIL